MFERLLETFSSLPRQWAARRRPRPDLAASRTVRVLRGFCARSTVLEDPMRSIAVVLIGIPAKAAIKTMDSGCHRSTRQHPCLIAAYGKRAAASQDLTRRSTHVDSRR